MDHFELVSEYAPTGDQPEAIEGLVKGFQEGKKCQTLLGVTGSGKTFTMANVIAKLNKPTIIISHNKTLAAQLYSEFKAFFPHNAVEYFVSYYDYYQPEAYVPSTDTYIAKDSAINDEIDKMRHSATSALIERKDVVVVSSVSCIYGLGDPEEYKNMMLSLRPGMEKDRDELIRQLIDIQYTRNEMDFTRGTFRVKGDIVDILPVSTFEDGIRQLIDIQYTRNEMDFTRGTFRVKGDIVDILPVSTFEDGIRIEFFGDEIDRIVEFDPLTGEIKRALSFACIFPASHYVVAPEKMKHAIVEIEEELKQQVAYFKENDKLLEAQRIRERTEFDMEMLQETGFCSGIENYSRILAGMKPGATPNTLLNFFDGDYLIIVDESHITLPQVRGMYAGDRSRKTTLVDYGFRLPSALDNRPLNFQEFESKIDKILYVSATPSDYEKEHEENRVEQIIRPTGLLDPEVEVRPIEGQVDDLVSEVNKEVAKGNKILVTTLTKRMAEDLTDYMKQLDIKVKYLHSDIDTLERLEIVRDLRMGVFDVLVGINLLREGLDIPEITLVAILDADKEGFLRSETSLVQTIGRAARNVDGHVIMYADTITDSMRHAIDETNRRRKIQDAYNKEHGITPQSIKKDIRDLISLDTGESVTAKKEREKDPESMTKKELNAEIARLTKKMNKAAMELNFEEAAVLRDELKELKIALRDYDD